ncbi:MAG: cell division protein FtsQ/DivIB [Pseudomonadota bacterium]
MRPLREDTSAAAHAANAGPSRSAYRMRRAWALPWVRTAVTVYLPLGLFALVAWGVISNDRLRIAVETRVSAMVDALAARPEFVVRGVRIEGGSPTMREEVRAVAGPIAGQSSLHLDLGALRAELEALGRVASASVVFDPNGTLRITVRERRPAALWRDPDGTLWVLDRAGVVMVAADRRLGHAELPLLMGLGAPRMIDEALQLMETAPALIPRVRALARVGTRRWTLVLDREMVVMLPSEDPVRALKGVMALQFGEEVFSRDLSVIDLRIPHRPVLRLAPRAAEAMVLRRAVDLVLGEET